MKLLITFAVIVLMAESFADEWLEFKYNFNHHYESEAEEQKRENIFRENLKRINSHNELYRQGKTTYKMGVNKYAAHTMDEIIGNCLRASNRQQDNNNILNIPTTEKAPVELDWRTKNIVTPVKDQQQCGSCWAFSTTGSLESQHALKSGKLVQISEQNLMDCSYEEGNLACNGGLMTNAFEYVKKNGGIDSEESYPYTAQTSRDCKYKKENSVMNITGYKRIKPNDENDLKEVVASIGPVSVGIYVDYDFYLYKEGIFYNPHCLNDENSLNHGVLVVGYGSTKKGSGNNDYWIVKNSWGEHFGENGYIKMARNKDNNCGIATDASVPII